MDRIRRERWEAHGYVLRAFGVRRAVLDPLPGRRDDGLSGPHFLHALARPDRQPALQHHRILLELRRLTRLYPAARALHPRDAHFGRPGVPAPDELFDDLRLVAGGLDAGGSGEVAGHNGFLFRARWFSSVRASW